MTNREIVDWMIEDAKEEGREIPQKLIDDYMTWDTEVLRCFYFMSTYWAVQ